MQSLASGNHSVLLSPLSSLFRLDSSFALLSSSHTRPLQFLEHALFLPLCSKAFTGSYAWSKFPPSLRTIDFSSEILILQRLFPNILAKVASHHFLYHSNLFIAFSLLPKAIIIVFACLSVYPLSSHVCLLLCSSCHFA